MAYPSWGPLPRSRVDGTTIDEAIEEAIAGVEAGGGLDWVDRGDPSVYDYDQDDLILDEAWHPLDLSSIVPDGDAVLITLGVWIRDDTVGEWIHFRKNGNVNSVSIKSVRTQAANGYNEGHWDVACDTSQVVEYRGRAGINSILILVCGWWKPA